MSLYNNRTENNVNNELLLPGLELFGIFLALGAGALSFLGFPIFVFRHYLCIFMFIYFKIYVVRRVVLSISYKCATARTTRDLEQLANPYSEIPKSIVSISK